MDRKYKYNTIEEALEDLRAGRIVLVTDHPDRENEGDMAFSVAEHPPEKRCLPQSGDEFLQNAVSHL